MEVLNGYIKNKIERYTSQRDFIIFQNQKIGYNLESNTKIENLNIRINELNEILNFLTMEENNK